MRQTGRRDRGVTLSRLQAEQPPPPAAATAELSLTSLISLSCWYAARDSLSFFNCPPPTVVFSLLPFHFLQSLIFLFLPSFPALYYNTPFFVISSSSSTSSYSYHCLPSLPLSSSLFFPLLILIFHFSFSAHPEVLSLSPSLSRTLCLWSRYCPLSHYQTVVLRGRCGSP